MKTILTTGTFDGWLKGLKDRAGAARILVRIQRLAMGNAGDHRNLTGGVSELKIDFGPGYRVYFTERDGEIIILLCGGSKKMQDKDVAKAIELAKEY
jgi:putative addiction module killer protein